MPAGEKAAGRAGRVSRNVYDRAAIVDASFGEVVLAWGSRRRGLVAVPMPLKRRLGQLLLPWRALYGLHLELFDIVR